MAAIASPIGTPMVGRTIVDSMPIELFDSFRLRGLEIPNRIWMPPMCQYSASDTGPETGAATDWHLHHYAARAVGGTGLIIIEATAVAPEGRIGPHDLGLWSDSQIPALARVVTAIREQGTVAAIQLGHAGRKAGTDVPWRGETPLPHDQGGWSPVGPSPLAFDDAHEVPHALTREELSAVVRQFAEATRRAVAAGIQAVEIHGAHGYLISNFLSPHSNRRDDEYGGSFDNRIRFPLEVVDAVRAAVPAELPLLFRISATEWIGSDGWDEDDTVRLAPLLREHGVDLLDVSTGGNVSGARIPVSPGYQVRFSARVRQETGLPTAAVGLLTEPAQAARVLADGAADAVLIGRELLRDPYWARHAARTLGVTGLGRPVAVPPQYVSVAGH